MAGESNFIEFSKPFIGAAKNIFETMVFTKIDPQKPIMKKDTISKGDITAVLGMTGELEKNGKKTDYKAMLVVSFPYDTYFKMASTMLGATYTEYVPEIHDLAGEMLNMIVGNAKRDLKALGYTSNMSIPSIVEKKGHSIIYPTNTIVVLIPINSSIGEFYMELCYYEII